MNIFISKPGSLKEYLESIGYLFPCKGEGRCGRCRIYAPSITPTKLDGRFLTKNDIQNGVRLACDKIISEPTEIGCELKLKPNITALENPSVYAIYGSNYTEFGLIDDGILVESIMLPAVSNSSREMTALFNTNVIELYEIYDIAKAETILLLGNPDKIQSLLPIDIPLAECAYFEASEARLPGVDILVPPIPTKLIGNDEFIELLYLPDDTLLISGGNFLYKDRDIVAASVGEDISSDFGKRAFRTTVLYFEEEFCPSNVFSFDHIEAIEGITIEKIDRRAQFIATDILSSHKRIAELNRLARRVVSPPIADDDVWQDIFSKL